MGSTEWAEQHASELAHAVAYFNIDVAVSGQIFSAATVPSLREFIRDGGLATSSTAARRWRHGGDVLHHILDPRTGLPAATPWRTVSVAAGNCLDANTASTAAILLGAKAPAWLTAHGLPARLVPEDGGPIVYTPGWPEDAEVSTLTAPVRNEGRAA